MGYMRVLCELGRDTNIPADVATNTWHFETVGTVASEASDAVDKLEAFYLAIDTYLAIGVTNSINCKVYDLEDASPRVPVLEQAFSITPSATTGYPEEVAICMSYHAAPVSGLSVARRRGRLFLGPLAASTGSSGTNNRVIVGTGPRTAIAVAAAALADTPTVSPVWSVFSPTTAGPPPWDASALGSAFHPVSGGYIDDAFDTQRSRGSATIDRTLFTL